VCGIFGYFCKKSASLQTVLELLEVLEKHRFEGEECLVGGHGAGVGFLDASGKLVIYKAGKKSDSPTKDLLEMREVAEAESRIVIGHVRRASDFLIDTVKYREAAQPYKVNCLGLLETISAHNGKVENYERIRRSLSGEHRFESGTAEVKLNDSEVIPHLFEENLLMYDDEIEARRNTTTKIEGNNTVLLATWLEGTGRLHVLHKGSTRGLHVWENDNREIILCSREEPLRQVFGDTLEEGNFDKVLSIKWKERREAQRTFQIVQA